MHKIKQLIGTSILAFGLLLTASKASEKPLVRPVDQDSVGLLKKAIAKYPDSLALHVQFLEKSDVESPTVAKQYNKWLTKYKKSAVVPYAYGAALMEKYDHKSEKWLKEAVARDPLYAAAWYQLSLYADFSGDKEKSNEYLRRAVRSEPNNPNYAFYNSTRLEKVDFEAYKKATFAFVKQFPKHQRAAQALYWLAYRTNDQALKISLYEKSLAEYPPAEYSWSGGAMQEYFSLLMGIDVKRAADLAKRMKVASDEQSLAYWTNNLELAEQIVTVKALMEQQKGEEAGAIIKGIKPQRGVMQEMFTLLAVESIATQGRVLAAYDSLMNMYAKTPIEGYEKALLKYGKQLGKNDQTVIMDAQSVISRNATPATPFALEQYNSPEKLTLADLKGKVVLLTYWYPGCGPCRAEFPHFEKVLANYTKEQIVYLGINIVRKQDEFVLPFMEESKSTFIPLKEVDGRDKGNLDNGGVAPVNFLIDKDGKIAFSKFMINGNNEDMLEKMISLLL